MNRNKSVEARIGVIYTGISYQHSVLEMEKYKDRFEAIPVCNLPKEDITSYDILIFPRGTDQEMAYAARKKIREFLDSSRIVISFGEVTKEWLPSCHWDGVVPEDDGNLSIIAKEHPIFKDLEDCDLHWHKGATGWCCHGHFTAPHGSEVLVKNEINDPMAYIDRRSTNGTILVTGQLDAFCHIYARVRGAEIFLDNVLNWAEDEIKELKGGD